MKRFKAKIGGRLMTVIVTDTMPRDTILFTNRDVSKEVAEIELLQNFNTHNLSTEPEPVALPKNLRLVKYGFVQRTKGKLTNIEGSDEIEQ